MQIKTAMRYHLTLVRMTIIKESTNNRYWKGYGEKRDQIANILWIIEKGRVFQKNIYFCFIDYAKAFDCVC